MKVSNPLMPESFENLAWLQSGSFGLPAAAVFTISIMLELPLPKSGEPIPKMYNKQSGHFSIPTFPGISIDTLIILLGYQQD